VNYVEQAARIYVIKQYIGLGAAGLTMILFACVWACNFHEARQARKKAK
jgi:hypothetical protein